MRIWIGTTAVSLTVAVFALGLTIWLLADAPWDDSEPTPPPDNTKAVRCDAAFSLRETIISTGRYNFDNNGDGLRDFDERMEQAEAEIDRYC